MDPASRGFGEQERSGVLGPGGGSLLHPILTGGLYPALSALAPLTPPSLCGVHPQASPSLPSCQLLQFQTQLFSSVLRQMESLITFYRLG